MFQPSQPVFNHQNTNSTRMPGRPSSAVGKFSRERGRGGPISTSGPSRADRTRRNGRTNNKASSSNDKDDNNKKEKIKMPSISRLLSQAKHETPILIVATIALFFAAALGLTIPMFFGAIIDSLSDEGTDGTLSSAVGPGLQGMFFLISFYLHNLLVLTFTFPFTSSLSLSLIFQLFVCSCVIPRNYLSMQQQSNVLHANRRLFKSLPYCYFLHCSWVVFLPCLEDGCTILLEKE